MKGKKRPPGAGGLESSRKYFRNAPDFGGFRGYRFVGIRTTNVLPSPSALRTEMVPPTMDRIR